MVSVPDLEALDGEITYLENWFLSMQGPLRVLLKGVNLYE